MVIRQKRVMFVLLLVFTTILVVLGIIASINFSGGVLVVDLSNISYVQFLKDECSFVSLIFKLLLSLFIFLLMICLFGMKTYLLPLCFLFYGYLIYSQTVILMSMILVYGFFNCVIFVLLLLIYVIIISFIFMLIILEISCHGNTNNYLKTLCNWTNSNLWLYLILMVVTTIIFCLVLTILKSFVLLLVY